MSLAFDGSSSKLIRAGSIGVSAYPFSVFAWIKPDAANGINSSIFTFAGSDEGGILCDSVNGNHVTIWRTGGGFWNVPASPDTSAWQPVLAVWKSADDRTIYYPGSSTGTHYTDNAPYDVTALSGLGIGARSSGSSLFYKGLIAHVAYWTAELSSSDFATLAAGTAPNAVKSGSLVDYWALSASAATQTGVNGRVLTATATSTGGSDPAVSGDTTPPNLSAATTASIAQTTATVGCTTDEGNGTLYAVVTTSATQPSIAQIKAGLDQSGSPAVFAPTGQTITSTGAKTFSATGLTANTSYYAHFVHADAAGNDSTRLSTSQFATLPNAPTAPSIGANSSVTAGGATINWTDNSSDETSFRVEVETPSGAGNWTLASSGSANPTAANVTSLVISSLSASTEYRPRVRAANSGGSSSWSTGTAFTTDAPSGTSGFVGSTIRLGPSLGGTRQVGGSR